MNKNPWTRTSPSVHLTPSERLASGILHPWRSRGAAPQGGMEAGATVTLRLPEPHDAGDLNHMLDEARDVSARGARWVIIDIRGTHRLNTATIAAVVAIASVCRHAGAGFRLFASAECADLLALCRIPLDLLERDGDAAQADVLVTLSHDAMRSLGTT